MWALLVCVLVKPVEIANGLDLQHGTSAECLDVATDGKGGRPSTFVVEVTRTSSCPNCVLSRSKYEETSTRLERA